MARKRNQRRPAHDKSIVTLRFDAAAAAVESGHYDAARAELQALIDSPPPSTHDERTVMLALARSKLHVIDAREERNRPEEVRQDDRIIEAYRAAARASREAGESELSRAANVIGHAHYLTSEAEKFAAFALLRTVDSYGDDIAALTRVEQHFAIAIREAEAAIAAGGPTTDAHVTYLRFWQAVVLQRRYLLQFLVTGNAEFLAEAVGANRDASAAAAVLPTSCFPNRYYSAKDVALEIHIISAAATFRRHDWVTCSDHLQRWLADFPDVYKDSWRFIQVKLRLHFVDALAATARRDSDAVKRIVSDVAPFKDAPVGNTGRMFCSSNRSAGRLRVERADGKSLSLLSSRRLS